MVYNEKHHEPTLDNEYSNDPSLLVIWRKETASGSSCPCPRPYSLLMELRKDVAASVASQTQTETAADMSRYMLTPKVKVDHSTWERDGIFPHKLPRLPTTWRSLAAGCVGAHSACGSGRGRDMDCVARSFTRLMTELYFPLLVLTFCLRMFNISGNMALSRYNLKREGLWEGTMELWAWSPSMTKARCCQWEHCSENVKRRGRGPSAGGAELLWRASDLHFFFPQLWWWVFLVSSDQ